MRPSPLVIEFVAGTRLRREAPFAPSLPIVGNGPPGTFVLFERVRVSLPTDQVVLAEDVNGTVTVGFGGFRFDGMRDGRLIFSRVRDLLPDSQLSPDRSWTMALEPKWVSEIHADGVHAWPDPSA